MPWCACAVCAVCGACVFHFCAVPPCTSSRLSRSNRCPRRSAPRRDPRPGGTLLPWASARAARGPTLLCACAGVCGRVRWCVCVSVRLVPDEVVAGRVLGSGRPSTANAVNSADANAPRKPTGWLLMMATPPTTITMMMTTMKVVSSKRSGNKTGQSKTCTGSCGRSRSRARRAGRGWPRPEIAARCTAPAIDDDNNNDDDPSAIDKPV